MKPIVLFRKSTEMLMQDDIDNEFNACSKFLTTHEFRSDIPSGSLVIGRYSVLPYYQELEKELINKNCKLVNSYEQHRYIADIRNYYADLADFTPQTWTQWGDLPDDMSFVVKGVTNSRKHQWNTHMFAKSNKDVVNVVKNLMNDTLICSQGIVVREFVPLRKIEEGINGMPMSYEWRFFFYKERMLCHGFYWSCAEDAEKIDIPTKVIDFAQEIAYIVSRKTNFFVLDIAIEENGDPILIEVNDGQMSGLSMCNPNELYENLSKRLRVNQYYDDVSGVMEDFKKEIICQN